MWHTPAGAQPGRSSWVQSPSATGKPSCTHSIQKHHSMNHSIYCGPSEATLVLHQRTKSHNCTRLWGDEESSHSANILCPAAAGNALIALQNPTCFLPSSVRRCHVAKVDRKEKKLLKYVTQENCPMNLSRLKVTTETTLHSPEELENVKLAVRKN